MGIFVSDVYHNPEEFGLETIGELELREPDYNFDILLVQRDTSTGKFYVNADSGCSCPSPFEDFTTKESLGTPLTAHEAVSKIIDTCNKFGEDRWSGYKPNPSELIGRVMNA